MDGEETSRPNSNWKPDWKTLLGEGYKEILKYIVLGILAYTGVLLSRGIPIVGDFLKQPFPLHYYQLILSMLTVFIAGICLDRILLGKRLRSLKEEANKDELTGLLNLRAKKRIMPLEMRRAYERQKVLDAQGQNPDNESFCAILLDIDNFKRVNDTATYESGNFVLKQFADLLNTKRKVTDQVFRIGGDEFLLLTPQTPLQGAVMYAEKLRNAVLATQFKTRFGKADISLTICAGVAEMKYPDTDNPDDLLKRANEALLRAKKKKNTVALY